MVLIFASLKTFDQTILQRLKDPLHATLGLRRIGQNGLDVQLPQGALKLGRCGVFGVVFGEDAVPVAVQRHRTAMNTHVTLQAVQVGAGGLDRIKARLWQLARGIVNEGDEAALARPVFKPGMRAAVNLHQLALAAAPLTRAVDAFDA